MVAIRKLMFQLLGLKKYLLLVSKSFFVLYDLQILRLHKSFSYHYQVKKLISKGDYIMDIGANLGYFTRLFARWTGRNGKVFSVEPIPLFVEILKHNTRLCNNVEIFPYALGEAEKEVVLTAPVIDGNFRSGLFSLNHYNQTDPDKSISFNARMKKGSELFSTLDKLDYLKCDVEGYEEFVLNEMIPVIKKFLPVIQIELWGDRWHAVQQLLESIGYRGLVFRNGWLHAADLQHEQVESDFIFIHEKKLNQHSSHIQSS